jgi:hypothetical protein
MKLLLVLALFLCGTRACAQADSMPNLVIVTIDGFRWQEVFNGADSALICDQRFTPDTALQKLLYWHDSPLQRREKLLPRFWLLVQQYGTIAGNRQLGSEVQVRNPYRLSYAGYNEMFTGKPDWRIFNNKKKINRNRNLFEHLGEMPAYEGRIALFSSWDVFPYILRKEKAGYYMNSGYETIPDSNLQWVNLVQQLAIHEKEATRKDWLTYITAREYMQRYQPRITYIALGETDEWAHHQRYDLYLQQVNAFDKMIADLWSYLQCTPAYRNNTVVIITTDHGRGARPTNWFRHGYAVKESGETWLAMLAPGIENRGEQQQTGRFYMYQLPSLVNEMLGIEMPGHELNNQKQMTYAIDSGK